MAAVPPRVTDERVKATADFTAPWKSRPGDLAESDPLGAEGILDYN